MENIIYLDALTKIKGFAAAPDSAGPLRKQFLNENEENKLIFKKLKKNYNLNSPSFNAGVMAFSTDLIKNNAFLKLKTLIQKYEKIRYTSDQMCWNLLFYKKWQRLPLVYNLLLFVFGSTGIFQRV